MKKLFAIFLFTPVFTFAQSVDWAKNIAIYGQQVFHKGDEQGNQYFAYWYEDSICINPSVNEVIHGEPAGKNQIFQKLSADGELGWAFNWPYPLTDYSPVYVLSVTTDNANNSYLAVKVKEEIDIDGSAEELIYTPLNEEGDVLLMKITEEGMLEWYKNLSSTDGTMTVSDLRIAEDNELLVLGYYTLNIDLDPTDDVDPLYAVGADDVFLAKFEDDGDLLWTKSYGGVGPDVSHKMEIGEAQSIWISGLYVGATDLNPDPELTEWLNGVYGVDSYILKLNEDGIFEMYYSYAGNGADRIEDFEFNSLNELIVLGNFDGEGTDLDPTEEGEVLYDSDAPMYYVTPYVQKITTEGTVAWINVHGWGEAGLRHLEIGNQDEIYLGGTFWDNFDIDPSDEEYIVENTEISPLHNDAFVAIFTTLGEFYEVWNFSQETGARMMNMQQDGENNLYVSLIKNAGDYDCDPSAADLVLTDEPLAEELLIKFEPSYVTVVVCYPHELPFEYFPNPVLNNQALYVQCPEKGLLTVYTIAGEKIKAFDLLEGTNTLGLNLAAGVYLLSVEMQGEQLTKRLVVK